MAEPGAAEYASEVQVTPLLRTTTTVIGQPIEYPKTDKPLVTTVLVEIPPGKETGWHTHPMPCFAYILQGTITVEEEGGKTFTYHAGQAIAEMINTPHNGCNLGTETVKIIMTVMGEQGKPIAVHLDKK
jgi:quercetin dioxygenase-like cupin family protein